MMAVSDHRHILEGYMERKCTLICVEVEKKTILKITPILSDLNLSVISRLVYCKSSISDHAASKACFIGSLKVGVPVLRMGNL
ncbi:unnamed protein product [Timema podura]|uniref:Uncharacterized protein n=1 Tax=Timema podura TaxID=61482 RepID=A0ABN7NE94_TIMPD|nr:unnamed protein product [Timema podura]